MPGYMDSLGTHQSPNGAPYRCSPHMLSDLPCCCIPPGILYYSLFPSTSLSHHLRWPDKTT